MEDQLVAVRQAFREGQRLQFVFFWLPDGSGIGPHCLSQWYAAPFDVEAVRYPTAEHYMMAEKARLFGDEETRSAILRASDPAAVQALGRKVRGFDKKLWVAHRLQIVVTANVAKFGQNESLCEYLAGTRERILVEASPKDRIWGIGLAATDARAENPLDWTGLNLLGFALMQVRHELSMGR
jgi:ribA/ribD-fused uncharacterized protein